MATVQLENTPPTLILYLIGDPTTGKSSLLARLTSNEFSERYTSTFIFEIKTKIVGTQPNKVKLQIWDINFEKEKRFCKNTIDAAGVFIFDLSNPLSFDSLNNSLASFKEACPLASIFVIGNKSDLGKRAISNESITAFVRNPSNNILQYFETSAKSGKGVYDTFERIPYLTSLKLAGTPAPKDTLGTNRHRSKEINTHFGPRGKLTERLQGYIDRIESYHSESLIKEIDFSYGFRFFSASRAINRQANYWLAKQLTDNLSESNESIATIFSDVDADRLDIINRRALNSLPNYTKRDIHSSELNAIIKDARNVTSAAAADELTPLQGL